MALTAVVELTVQPGRRDELVKTLEELMAKHSATMHAAGWHSSNVYAVVDDPDKLVEIAEWESVEAREAALQSAVMAEFAPVFQLLAAPFSATLLTALH